MARVLLALAAMQSPRLEVGRDLAALAKPGITLANVLMVGAGLLVAPAAATAWQVLAALVGTALVVAAANTFNMIVERERDALMARTRHRPLAAGRMTPRRAWVVGALATIAGTLVLARGTNVATAGIGLAALVVYAFVYTPLKVRTPWAALIGALPGATPPLMGVMAVAPDEPAPGLALAAIVALWQLPHVLAIAARRKDDYARAGIRAWPVVHGERSTLRVCRVSALLLVPAGLLPMLVGDVGIVATVILCALGVALVLASRRPHWARATFVASLLYLPLATLGLGLDRLVV